VTGATAGARFGSMWQGTLQRTLAGVLAGMHVRAYTADSKICAAQEHVCQRFVVQAGYARGIQGQVHTDAWCAINHSHRWR
jgi:hypothetical protein